MRLFASEKNARDRVHSARSADPHAHLLATETSLHRLTMPSEGCVLQLGRLSPSLPSHPSPISSPLGPPPFTASFCDSPLSSQPDAMALGDRSLDQQPERPDHRRSFQTPYARFSSSSSSAEPPRQPTVGGRRAGRYAGGGRPLNPRVRLSAGMQQGGEIAKRGAGYVCRVRFSSMQQYF